jgi:hypothetical protein
MTDDYPKIRPLEAHTTQVSGREVVTLSDPSGITPETMMVSPETFFLLRMMDGSNSLRDLQAAYMRRYGMLLYTDILDELLRRLDAVYLLDNNRFRTHVRSLHDDFMQAPTREPAFAGAGYEETPDGLTRQIEGYFTDSEGPGDSIGIQKEPSPQGIIAPHIDFARGGTCYARAYHVLSSFPPADLFVILGTCHKPMQTHFALTKKTFRTPLGEAPVATDVVARIAPSLPYDPFHDEFHHRGEHTIEFQVVFLHHLFRTEPVHILPVLCGSFHEYIVREMSPMNDTGYRQSIEVFREALADISSVCLIASADLAHVGAQFGDTQLVTSGVRAEVERKDLEMLNHVENMDAEGFYNYVFREKDRRNICGLPPVYALLHLLQAKRGELLRYQQWHEPRGTGMVTFASLAFF